jgi:hypothetical protein
MMVTQETQEFLDTGSDFLKDNSHTSYILVLLVAIDAVVVVIIWSVHALLLNPRGMG